MPHLVKEENVNIEVKPMRRDDAGSTEEITLGDLHGNPIKLLYSLVREGIIDLSDTNYAAIVALYKTPVDALTPELIAQYNTLLDQIRVINPTILVRLLGDELADRGQNDWFTLLLLQKLHISGVDYEILLSNHGIEFLTTFETLPASHLSSIPTRMEADVFLLSMMNLLRLIERGVVKREEVLSVVTNVYKKHLVVFSFNLEENNPGITIYSHAPVGLVAISRVAAQLGCHYDDTTADSLATSLTFINIKFQKYVLAGTVHTLMPRVITQEHYINYPRRRDFKIDMALEFVLWNRIYTDLDEILPWKYSVAFVHGHDSSDHPNLYRTTLDNLLGKTLDLNVGEYSMVLKKETGFSLQSSPLMTPLSMTLACDWEEDPFEEMADTSASMSLAEFALSRLSIFSKSTTETVKPSSSADVEQLSTPTATTPIPPSWFDPLPPLE